MKKVISLFVSAIFLLILASLVSSGEFSYQENADEVGTSGIYGWVDEANLYDLDWTTFAYTNQMSGAGIAYLYINYTKPAGVSSNSLWQVKDSTGIVNLSIDSACWEQNPLQFITYSKVQFTELFTEAWGCYDGTEWIYTRVNSGDEVDYKIYEEAMWWFISDDVEIEPYTTMQLPQLESSIAIDNEGLDRTYLYCTWRIDDLGEEAILMDGELCPAIPIDFTFEDNEKYYVRIDYADIAYNGTEWVIIGTGNAGELEINYIIDIPEPPANLLEQVYNTILATVTDRLCNVFPWLWFC